MSNVSISNANRVQELMLNLEQSKITTIHSIYEGVYTRTIVLKAGEALVGALIKIPTTLLINGKVQITIDENNVKEINGFDVFLGYPNRKQIMFAHEDTSITMLFKTDAKTIEEAEEEFTDEYSLLMSRNSDAINVIYTKE